MSDEGSPGVVMITIAWLIATLGLMITILAKVLSGEFAVTSSGLRIGTVSSTLSATTTSKCLVSMEFQGEGNYLMSECAEMEAALRFPDCYPTGVSPWHPENNTIIQMPNPATCSVAISETWTVAGWDMTFVQIAPQQVFQTQMVPDDYNIAVKIIKGTLLDINVNGILHDDGTWETFTVTPPNRGVTLFIDNDITDFPAGGAGATIVYFKIPKSNLNTPITDMTAPPIATFAGPYSENFKWVNFGDYYEAFEGVDFNNFAGFLLRDYDGSRLNHMQFWTMREDMDADGYHNHSDLDVSRAFAELHMALYAASASSGMQTTLPGTQNLEFKENPSSIAAEDEHKYNQNDQTEVQIAIPLSPGSVHGPLWSIDNKTGAPTSTCTGGIQYPYHRWIAGRGLGSNGYHSPPRYSSWVAFEHPPQYATIPTTMLEYWANSNLQSTMDPVDCSEAETKN